MYRVIPLSPEQIYQRQSPRFDTTADPIAYAVHVAFISNGFQLVGLDEDLQSGDQSYEGLPGAWNANSGVYTFRYRINDILVVCKCLSVDQSVLIHANLPGSDRIISLELIPDDYLQSNHNLTQPSAVYSNLDDLVALISDRIVKEFQSSAGKMSSTSTSAFNPYEYHDDDDGHDPLRIPSRGPIRPHGDFDGDLGPRPRIDPYGDGSPAGGSYMGPDHPMFIRGRGRRTGPRVPRFDPFGPDRGFTGDPNRDIFMPPGFGNGGGTGPGHFPF